MIRILEDGRELNYLDTLENFPFPLTIYSFIFFYLVNVLFLLIHFLVLTLQVIYMERSVGEIQYARVVDILYKFNSFNL